MFRIDLAVGSSAPAACSQRPGATQSLLSFARRRLELKLERDQRRILAENPSRAMLLCSRQWGKSFLGAIRALWLASTHPRSSTMILSLSLEQAIAVLDQVRALSARPKLPISYSGSRQRIVLFNGSTITARPARPPRRPRLLR